VGKIDRFFQNFWSVSRSDHYFRLKMKIQNPKYDHFSQFVSPKIRDPGSSFFAKIYLKETLVTYQKFRTIPYIEIFLIFSRNPFCHSRTKYFISIFPKIILNYLEFNLFLKSNILSLSDLNKNFSSG